MATAKVTLMGLMQWDQTLFDDIVIPEEMDKDVLIGTIQLRCADYEVLYPDWDFFKMASDLFFKKHQLTFKRWWDATHAEYDPLYNYDRYEDLNEKIKDSETSNNHAEGETKTAVSAFDQAGFSDNGKVNDNSTSGGSLKRDHDRTNTNHIYGNIGVTTSTAMINEYLKAQAENNVYNNIADLFASEFCLLVE